MGIYSGFKGLIKIVFRLSRLVGVCALRTVCWKLDGGDIKNCSLFAVGIYRPSLT